jgi:predicted nucleic acid-binding protein
MKVIADTCIWSLALRRTRNQEAPEVDRLQDLIRDGLVQMLGPIRQEIFSGIKTKAQFTRLKKSLRAFPDLELTTDDYEVAAQFFNTCRSKGIQGSNTDFLICAVSAHHNFPVFTTDKDFKRYKAHLKIELY